MSTLSEVAVALQARLQAAKVELGLQDVFFGDLELIPRTPAICVAPVMHERVPTAMHFKTEDVHNLWLYVYHGKVQDKQTNMLECMQFAEAVVAKLHEDKTNSGTVIFSFVSKVELGASVKATNELFVATRLTWQSLSKNTL